MPRRLLVARLACALAALGVFAAGFRRADETAQAGALALTHPAAGSGAPLSPERSGPVELRTWDELRADATRLLGRRVRLVVQFQGRVERWNSYLSRFGPHDYSAFQFWADEQQPWCVDDFQAPIVRLFTRRDSGAEAALERGARYARFEVEGLLLELFLGEPWIEVESARVLPERLTEGSVIHGGRALLLMDSGLWRLAESELDIALQASVPARAREEFERLRSVCRENAAAQRPSSARSGTRPWKGPAPNVRPPRRNGPDD